MKETEMSARVHRSFSHWLHSTHSIGWIMKLVDWGGPTPFDMVGCLPGGRTLCIENKVNRLQNALNLPSLFSNGRKAQVDRLMHLQAVGALCWVLIAWKDGGSWRLFGMRPEIAEGLLRNGTSRMDELLDQKMITECPRLPESIWDLTPILK